MLFGDSFKKDWNITKAEMQKKNNGELPAETKTYDLLFFKVEKSVSSGIGSAFKALDEAIPKDQKNPDKKDIEKFRKAHEKAKSAVNSTLTVVGEEVKKLKSGDKKKEDVKKDSYYRALKVFKAKLDLYLASAEGLAVTLESAAAAKLNKTVDGIKLFKAYAMQQLTDVAVQVKTAMEKPSAEGGEKACSHLISFCTHGLDKAYDLVQDEVYCQKMKVLCYKGADLAQKCREPIGKIPIEPQKPAVDVKDDDNAKKKKQETFDAKVKIWNDQVKGWNENYRKSMSDIGKMVKELVQAL